MIINQRLSMHFDNLSLMEVPLWKLSSTKPKVYECLELQSLKKSSKNQSCYFQVCSLSTKKLLQCININLINISPLEIK